jgi:hypothetical protein
LKIGFELKGFTGLKKSEIDLEESKEKIPTDKIRNKLKKQGGDVPPNFRK